MLEPNLHQNTVANYQTQARLTMAASPSKSPLVASHQNYQQQQPEHESYLACYEDLSSIYRQHRKRPRSTTYSPFDSASPASSTATNTTADSLLGSSSIIFGSDLTASCNSRPDSSLLSPPPLTFNLLSASPVSLDSVGPSGAQTTSCKGKVCSRAASLRSVSSVECNGSIGSSSGAASTSSEEDEPEEASDLIGPDALLASDTEDSDAESEVDDGEDEQLDRCCHLESGANRTQEDERIFHNLILKEQRHAAHNLAYTMNRQRLTGERDIGRPVLRGHLRQSLLSWMLHVCVQEQCQDEIFALATIILDKFLSLHPTLLRKNNNNRRHQQQQQVVVVASNANGEQQSLMIETYERELEQRQLVQFASCSLMLATKLRQTPRLSIRTLIELSQFELPVALTHDDLTLGERFMLDLLKWDIAGLVTPNEFLHELLTRKCQRVMFNFISQSSSNNNHQKQEQEQKQQQVADNRMDQDDNQPSDDRRQHRHHYLERQHHSRRQDNLKSTSNHHHHHQNNRNHRNHSPAKCKVNRVNRHTQILLELCMLDDHLSQLSPSTLAMASMAVAIYGLSTTAEVNSPRLDDIVEQIYESTDRVNKLELMIEVAHQIEGFLQEEAKKTTPFGNIQHD